MHYRSITAIKSNIDTLSVEMHRVLQGALPGLRSLSLDARRYSV